MAQSANLGEIAASEISYRLAACCGTRTLMEIVKQTDEYQIIKKRNGRYGVRRTDRKWVSGEQKVQILVAEGLLKAQEPKPAPAEEADAAAAADAETQGDAEAEGDAEGQSDGQSEAGGHPAA